LEQTVIVLIVIVLGLGLLRYAAKIIALGLIIFVGIPFIFTDVVIEVDWSRLKNRTRAFVATLFDLEMPEVKAADEIEASLTYLPSSCSLERPLRLEMQSLSTQRIGQVAYKLSHRPQDRTAPVSFTEGTSDQTIAPGNVVAYCVLMPPNARRDDLFSVEITDVRYIR